MSSDLLAGLTAERLGELARWHERIASGIPTELREIGGYVALLESAAVLRALAGAERAMIPANGRPGEWGFFRDDRFVGSYPREAFGQPTNTYPTLISALASVAKQEETNDG